MRLSETKDEKEKQKAGKQTFWIPVDGCVVLLGLLGVGVTFRLRLLRCCALSAK